MIVTRGPLTPAAFAGLTVLAAECVECGQHGIFATAQPDRAAISHRCPTCAAGPVWTLVEPPARPAPVEYPAGSVNAARVAAGLPPLSGSPDELAAGLHAVEQAGAAGGEALKALRGEAAA